MEQSDRLESSAALIVAKRTIHYAMPTPTASHDGQVPSTTGEASQKHTIWPFIRAKLDLTSDQPLDDGDATRVQSLIELIDFNHAHNASHTFCIQAKSDGSLSQVTHAEFKAAVSRCATWAANIFENTVAPDGIARTDKAPVALLMESDVGLVIHEFALISNGTPPLVLSPRLPLMAMEGLLKTVAAKTIIVSRRLSIGLKSVLDGLASKGIAVIVSNPYEEFLQPGVGDGNLPSLPKPKTLDDTILFLHSSGSTGLPKPIPLTHRMLLSAVNCHEFHTEAQAQGLNLTTLPMFHGFGLVAPGLSMSVGKATLFPASDGIPNAQSILELIRKTNARSMMTVPFLLDDICNLPDQEGIKALAHMDFVGTGGAALSSGVGDRLTAGGVKLLNFYGVTETGPLSLTFVPTANYDWRFFRLRKDIDFKVDELEPRGSERRFRLTVFTSGKEEGFEIADQLIRNEKHPDLDFAAVGRDDDIIVLATGEKADPLILENMLTEAPTVKSAVAFGDNRFNIGVIVEPQQELNTPEAASTFRGFVWGIVEAAGQKMDSSARVPSPDAIIVVPAGMSVPRTDKGSIARKEAYTLFAKEIDQVYKKLLQAATEATGPLNLDNLEDNLMSIVRQHVVFRTATPDWNAGNNLFEMGIDSLQIQQLRRIIVAAASKTPGLDGVELSKLVPPQFIYLNPTVRDMAAAINENSVAEDPNLADTIKEAIKEVNECVDKFRLPPPTTINHRQRNSSTQAVVLLTGSSGSLGSHCLAELARRPNVKRIICLIRKEGGTNAQPIPGGASFDRKILKSKGMELHETEWAKASTIEVDPAAHHLGLNQHAYAGLQSMVTHIIHAAWPMNYLLPLWSFHPQFVFLRNLLELAANGSGDRATRFLFISSIAAVARIGLESGGAPIAEAPVSPDSAAYGVGYADGKLVCEKILEQAARDYAGQLEVASVRCGQMAGARASGAWNEKEQIPMLLKTGQSMGSLPVLPGTLSWIPVDDAASIITDFALLPHERPTVLHLENPTRQPWSVMMGYLSSELGLPVPVTPFDEWLGDVTNRDNNDEDYPVEQLHLFFKRYFQTAACGQIVLDPQVAYIDTSSDGKWFDTSAELRYR
ncbi:hypothetical protein PG985_014731 [Apiospora marii]|uniref:uncharacterized protein n=1 Tax=Apiospora marii TaxID=335849 RepID=UPI00312FF99A